MKVLTKRKITQETRHIKVPVSTVLWIMNVNNTNLPKDLLRLDKIK